MGGLEAREGLLRRRREGNLSVLLVFSWESHGLEGAVGLSPHPYRLHPCLPFHWGKNPKYKGLVPTAWALRKLQDASGSH